MCKGFIKTDQKSKSNALNQLHTNKSSGMIGFTLEFYKAS